ncbi:MAG: hypothetical protein ACRDS0_11765 [Pseudonocardiaceae bacterium]
MKIRDRKRWERELTAHMRRHAADIHKGPQKRAEPAGMWMTAPRLILWTLMVIIITSGGWALGLYVF